MSDVVPLREAKPEPSKVIVDVLKDLLSRAERGEVLAFAGVADMRGHETATAHSMVDGGSISNLVCGIERLKLRLLAIGGDDTP